MASKRRLRRQCERKVKFKTEKDARHAKSFHQYSKYYPYKCKFCKHFHLGHPNKKTKQSIRDSIRNSLQIKHFNNNFNK